MKKTIPKWKIIENIEKLENYDSEEKIKVLDKIYRSYDKIEASDIDKYLITQSFFNKFFLRFNFNGRNKCLITNNY